MFIVSLQFMSLERKFHWLFGRRGGYRNMLGISYRGFFGEEGAKVFLRPPLWRAVHDTDWPHKNVKFDGKIANI